MTEKILLVLFVAGGNAVCLFGLYWLIKCYLMDEKIAKNNPSCTVFDS